MDEFVQGINILKNTNIGNIFNIINDVKVTLNNN